MELMAGISAKSATTSRLQTHYYESGPTDGIPVLLIHGNLSTGRFYEHVMSGAPDRYRFIAPDMRCFGRSEGKALDATRGLRDWADDIRALVEHLGITSPIHLVGWSTGGAAIANYAVDHPGAVASLTFIDPVSPYGFGGCHRDGTPCFPDWSGTGGGTGNPDFISRLASGDRGDESPFSPRNVIKASYWAATHDEPRLDVLLEEVLLSATGDANYPGNASASENWPGMAPGTTGILNALSGRYCNWSDIVDIADKPPILWTHGSNDIVVADGSAWEMGSLGAAGYIPGWPGVEVYPPQMMVTQIRDVLESYANKGGNVRSEIFEGSGHGPLFDAAEKWKSAFFTFLSTAS
jgi:pimeloyl-ACP methyl ester carboxylesterase